MADVVRSRRHGSNTALTEAVFSTEGDTVPSRKVLSGKKRKGQRYTTQYKKNGYSASDLVYITKTANYLQIVHTKQAGW